jgi:hypothetical protein
VCNDEVFPYIKRFGKGFGRNNDPRVASIFVFVIAFSVLMIGMQIYLFIYSHPFVGDLNSIAPLISNFFLATYTLVNYACFHASHSGSPGWSVQ